MKAYWQGRYMAEDDEEWAKLKRIVTDRAPHGGYTVTNVDDATRTVSFEYDEHVYSKDTVMRS